MEGMIRVGEPDEKENWLHDYLGNTTILKSL